MTCRAPIAAAIALADSGIPVFPCLDNKRPAVEDGFKAATLDPASIWTPSATLIGVPTGELSGFDVLDIDPGKGGDVWLAEHSGRLPATQIRETRSGGRHILFRHAPGVRNSASRIAPGVDVRGDGGYVIDWPSAGCAVVNDSPIADWPKWLLQPGLVLPKAKPAGDMDVTGQPATIETDDVPALIASVLARISNAGDGEKHATLRDAALQFGGILHATGHTFDQAHALLIDALPADVDDWENASNTARWGLEQGCRRPFRVIAPQTAADEFGTVPIPDDALVSTVIALPEMTEDAAALAFAARQAGRFLYDHDDGRWVKFVDGHGWAEDGDGEISRSVRAFVRAARTHWGKERQEAKAAGKIGFSTAVERACQCDERMAVTRDRWDADPFAIGVPGGWIDLTTGDMHAADPGRFVRRFTAVAPASRGTSPARWTRFLDEATGSDTDLNQWLQRFAGYVLTGDMREEVIAFFYGSGGNGKGVFLHTLSAIMGDHAYQAPAELFKADSRTNREYQVAKLDGKRLVLASETEAGAALAEAFVKELSGNEGKINARHVYGRPFEFRSQAKLLIVGNHAPSLQGRSPAMERRLRVVPFNHRPVSPDANLKESLAAEYPAILRWMVDGCLAWQRRGLGSAPAIAAASESYFAEQDAVALWIDERCQRDPACKVILSKLAQDFSVWLHGRGERPVDAKAFKESMLRQPGCAIRKTELGLTVFGLALRFVPTAGAEFVSR